MCYHLIIQKKEGLIMNNTELFNVLQNAVSDAANEKFQLAILLLILQLIILLA